MLWSLILVAVLHAGDVLCWRELGCYRRPRVGVKRGNNSVERKTSVGGLTLDLCAGHCKGNTRYAAAHWRKECLCFSRRPSYKRLVRHEECNSRCEGNTTQNCGGFRRYTVLDLAEGMRQENFISFNYVGCYQADKVLTNLSSRLMTPEYCAGYCHILRSHFPSVYNGGECWCGEGVEDHEREPDSKCNLPCSGDPSLTCGGSPRFIAVYQTEILEEESGTWLGCYSDGGRWEKAEGEGDDCRAACLGANYAAIDNNGFCQCSQRRPSIKDSEPDGTQPRSCASSSSLSVFDITGLKGVDIVEGSLIGCYRKEFLQGPKLHNLFDATPERCLAHCFRSHAKLAALHLGEECICGEGLTNEKETVTGCNLPCSGDESIHCGGENVISVYRAGVGYGLGVSNGVEDGSVANQTMSATRVSEVNSSLGCYKVLSGSPYQVGTPVTRLPPQPDSSTCPHLCHSLGFQFATVLPRLGNCICGSSVVEAVEKSLCSRYNLDYTIVLLARPKEKAVVVGCYRDTNHRNERLTKAGHLMDDEMSHSLCSDHCSRLAFTFAAITDKRLCWCSLDLPRWILLGKEEECHLGCPGGRGEYCGGLTHATFLYATGVSVSEIRMPKEAEDLGCWEVDKLTSLKEVVENSSPVPCLAHCFSHGYLLAAIQRDMCYCNDQVPKSSKKVECEGKRDKGKNLHFYTTSISTVEKSSWDKVGCFRQDRLYLSGHKFSLEVTNSPSRCANLCTVANYIFSGTMDRTECYCWNGTMKGRERLVESECSGKSCPGDPYSFCATHNTILVYLTGLAKGEGLSYGEGTAECLPSPSRILGKRNLCSGESIFSDHFTEERVDLAKWRKDVYFSKDGFVMFTGSENNCYTQWGSLYLRPTVEHSVDNITTLRLQNCTSRMVSECKREGIGREVVPPVASASITTAHPFKYAIVEIKAKFSIGDWIISEIYLESEGGEKVVLGRVRGNRRLSDRKGGSVLEASLEPPDGNRTLISMATRNQHWGQAFHNITLVWTQYELRLLLDGKLERRMDSQPWLRQMYYLRLRVSAGGVDHFRDGIRSGAHPKPWANHHAKAVLKFWCDRKNWEPTWQAGTSPMRIDYVKVTAL